MSPGPLVDERRRPSVSPRHHASRRLLTLSVLTISTIAAFGAETIVFGPQIYQRHTGAPEKIASRFTVAIPADPYTLRVVNHGVTAAEISVNGREVLGPNAFTRKKTKEEMEAEGPAAADEAVLALIERPVSLNVGINEIEVTLRSKPGSWLTVEIGGIITDTTPPTITAAIDPPANANGWNTTPVTVSFTCSDAGSGVATCPAPIVVSTDGANQQISGTAVDVAGNSASTTVRLNVDQLAPALSVSPSGTVSTTAPLIEIGWTDQTSGVDASTFRVLIDGLDYTPLFMMTAEGASYVTRMSGGQHLVTARVHDRSGNESLASSNILVSAFNALPQAVPTSGTAPLTVTFTTQAEYTDGAIIRYRWDFQGDGIYDTNDPGARNYTFTYTQRGIFKATLEVLNDKKQVATATVPITVTGRPPVPTASVNPSNGAVPLQVSLLGAATDPDGTIVRYEWDVDGDGVFEFTSATTGNTTHTYAEPGAFHAVFRVTDSEGLTATAPATATAVRPGPTGSPTATITVPSAPRTIVAPLTVAFNGTGSDADGSIVRYEWDFNGDGVYDYTSATTASTSFLYTSPGIFTAALRVTDDSGLTGIDTVDITANIAATLSLPENTCRPQQGGTVTIRTTLGGSTRVNLILKDRSGQTIRTLISGVERIPGTYLDTWDCRDGAGDVVREGVYYAVLQYLAGGAIRSVDLTNTTGGQLLGWEYLMEGSNCFSCSYLFRPLEDDLLDVDFTVPRASEMSLSIRLFFRIDEVVSVFDRRLYGTGTHRIQWDGADGQGRLLAPPPGEQFLFGLTRFTLPDNAIFVEGQPEITAVAADPNYFDPGTDVSSGAPATRISFAISKPATVVLQVFNTTTNRLLRTLSKVVAAGNDTIAWDGRTDAGLFAAAGDYRLSLRAVDSAGNQSIVHYARVRVFY
jgi:flagellar hook assembly protein FlgD